MLKKYCFLYVSVVQAVLLYVLPTLFLYNDSDALMVLMLICSFMLAMLVGVFCKKKAWLFPLVSAVLYLPAVWAFDNGSFVHMLYFIAASGFGTVIGFAVDALAAYIAEKKKNE